MLTNEIKISFNVRDDQDKEPLSILDPSSKITINPDGVSGPAIPFLFSKPLLSLGDSAFFLINMLLWSAKFFFKEHNPHNFLPVFFFLIYLEIDTNPVWNHTRYSMDFLSNLYRQTSPLQDLSYQDELQVPIPL